MRKAILATTLVLVLMLAPVGVVAAHTGQEAEGRDIQEKLQGNELQCEELSDDEFYKLGEYFMGQMTGDQHETMGTMMNGMMGEDSSEQMHITMGKRMSGCEPDAMMANNNGMMSMMSGGIMGGSSFMGGFGMVLMILFMILFWGLIILGIVALVKWLTTRSKQKNQKESALDILKKRYAKGDISKEAFEKKKKELS